MPHNGISGTPSDWAYQTKSSERIVLSEDIDSLFDPEELETWTLGELAMIFASPGEDPIVEGQQSLDDTALRARLHNRIRNRILNPRVSHSDGDVSQEHGSEERTHNDKE